MAHSAQPSASHPSQSDDNLFDRDDMKLPTSDVDSHLGDYRSSNHGLSDSYLSNSYLNGHTNEQTLDNPTSISLNAPLRVHVERVVREYFAALDDEMPTDFYNLILKEVELPLLTVVLEQTRGNQTKCAQILGLNRGTLRKKLKTYGLM